METTTNIAYKSVQTAYGAVQYLDAGPLKGEIILFSTGGGTSFKAASAFEWMFNEGYRILSINRPGYYDLPLSEVSSIAEHADIYYAVVKSLKIEKKINVSKLCFLKRCV